MKKEMRYYPNGNVGIGRESRELYGEPCGAFRKENAPADLSYLLPTALLPLEKMVQEVCRQMDYEGSLLYDRYPDKVTMERLAGAICCQYEQDGGSIKPEYSLPIVELLLIHQFHICPVS